MAIRCPKCGHDYDVTLFQFGRTVKCDCGATVRLMREPFAEQEKRCRSDSNESEGSSEERH